MEAKADDAFLFPGLELSGNSQCRTWSRPITSRGFRERLHQAAAIITKKRLPAWKAKQTHPFDEVDLRLLGSHSFKKTAVCLVKEQAISTPVMALLTGRTVKVLDDHYDQASAARIRIAVRKAISGVTEHVTKSVPAESQPTEHVISEKRCFSCDVWTSNAAFLFCGFCGGALVSVASSREC